MYARDPIWHDNRLSMGHWGRTHLARHGRPDT